MINKYSAILIFFSVLCFTTCKIGSNPPIVTTVDEYRAFIVGANFNMIGVEVRTLSMGGNDYCDEQPIHRVPLSSYYIGDTKVKQQFGQAVMGINPSSCNGNWQQS